LLVDVVIQWCLKIRKSEKSDYSGLASVQGRRRAVILVASGIDTFSKINYGDARKVLQNSGVPVYIIGTANLFKKIYGDHCRRRQSDGNAGRMSCLQADNTLQTFAKETGGAYFPVTFEGELPKVLAASTRCCVVSTVSRSIRVTCAMETAQAAGEG
jgi:hypothetical protein